MKMPDFVLTSENYYTPEADQNYMSCSQYQSFLECEAKALAKVEGRWIEKESEAFLVGNYFHSYFESPEAHEAFCRQHFENIFKTKKDKFGNITITGKYAPYQKADEMIKVMESDETIKRFLDMIGENEMMMKGEIFGVPWKIKLDKYLSDRRLIIDYKTCANIQELKYNPSENRRETFVETYGYLMRAAIYCEIEKQVTKKSADPMFMLICVSKQDFPDKELLLLNHRSRLDYELDTIKQRLPRIVRIKNYEIYPKRCGYCDYCRATKKIKGIIPYYKLDPEFRDSRDDDYAISYDNLEEIQTS